MDALWPAEPLDLSLPSDPTWRALTERFMGTAQGQALEHMLTEQIDAGIRVFPHEVFRALKLTAFNDVSVVILGQDPYHGLGQAEGLAFSVPQGVKCPPSLRNIHKEILRDLGIHNEGKTSLVPWARQGVLLLNAVLTVQEGKAGSHAKKGWETLTDQLIQALSERQTGCVFMLWGNYAQSKRPLIDERKHKVLMANHPSPLSALRPPIPFIGCGHFRAANTWLMEQQKAPIDWAL